MEGFPGCWVWFLYSFFSWTGGKGWLGGRPKKYRYMNLPPTLLRSGADRSAARLAHAPPPTLDAHPPPGRARDGRERSGLLQQGGCWVWVAGRAG